MFVRDLLRAKSDEKLRARHRVAAPGIVGGDQHSFKANFASLCPVAHRGNGDFRNGLDGGHRTGSGLGRVLDHRYFGTLRFFFTGKPILGGRGGLYAPLAIF